MLVVVVVIWWWCSDYVVCFCVCGVYCVVGCV